MALPAAWVTCHLAIGTFLSRFHPTCGPSVVPWVCSWWDFFQNTYRWTVLSLVPNPLRHQLWAGFHSPSLQPPEKGAGCGYFKGWAAVLREGAQWSPAVPGGLGAAPLAPHRSRPLQLGDTKGVLCEENELQSCTTFHASRRRSHDPAAVPTLSG